MSDETSPPTSPNGRIDWTGLIDEHRRWLSTVVYSRLGDHDAVDEVLQEVAVAVLHRPPESSATVSPTAWLYRVAVLQSLNHRRLRGRRQRRLRNFAHSNGRDETSNDYSPLGWLLADEQRQLVQTALSGLRPQDREILLLKYTENWDCRQLADHLGISTSAVENRLDRARWRLRHELARWDVNGDQP